MQEQSDLELDQLWFTWSRYGLGSMPMGFRVRAASEGFYDTQGMYYRRVNRFLSYKMPEGASVSEFSPNIAPTSLSFVYNGEEQERLLLHKVFTGADGVGRNGAFFTHLIAGLPGEFTARDAIRLWYCPELWVDSEEGKAPHDTRLEKIRYSQIRQYADHPQSSFSVGPVSEPLQNLLLLILSQGLPQRILMRGHSSMIAPLIYGLTHALPMKLLPGLTFTTYESNAQESETLVTGTINGTELRDITRVQVQPRLTTGPISDDLQLYVTTAVNALLTGSDIQILSNMINEFDEPSSQYASVKDLIELFKRRFHIGPLTPKQWEDTVLIPTNNLQDLRNPAFQTKAAQLLLSEPDYWVSRGRAVIQDVKKWLASPAKSLTGQQAREAMVIYINGTVEYLFSMIRTELSQGTPPQHSKAVLIDFAHPSANPSVYQRMLTEFAQEPLYRRIRMDALWSFQFWLLSCARLMQPLPMWEDILPWLHISAWDKLADVLNLDLPEAWEHQAIYDLLSAHREIPKTAYTLVKAHEARFSRAMQSLLLTGNQTGNADYTDAALRLFAAVIHFDEQDHSYPNRAGLLLDLLNAVPNDSAVIEALVVLIPFASPYQLTMQEFDRVVAGCRSEVLTAGGASPSLMRYLQEYILVLTPKKLNENTISLLKQFQRAAATLPEDTAKLVNSWLDMSAFLANQQFDDKKLRNIEQALASLVPLLQERGQDTWQTFIQELAPYLTTLIETEYHLQSVLNVFEGARVVAAWDLLNVLAARICALYAENLELYQLFPYVIVGIREYARSGQPANVLDAYLQTLFARVSDNALSDIDKTISTPAWAEPIQVEWKGWRERSKPSLKERVINVLPGRQSRSHSPNLPGPQAMILPNQVSPERSDTQQPPQNTTDIKRFTFTFNGEKYGFDDSSYQQFHRILAVVLPYWINKVLHGVNQNTNDSIQSEEKTIGSLLEELQRFPPMMNSENLVQYFVDDFLIKREISKLREKRRQEIDDYLNTENFITDRLLWFQAYVGRSNYQGLSASYGEKAIKEALASLIRRYHFILYSNANVRGGWDKWAEKERKQVKNLEPTVRIER